MRTSSVQELTENSIELYTLPDIYFQLTEMITDPRFSAEDLGRVIIKDPALSIRLLKLVNNSRPDSQSKIDTVSRAVVVVDTEDLKKLLLGTSIIDSFRDIPPDLVNMTDFWIHSLRCGVIVRRLARETLVLHCERLFLAGLLHNIGSLLIYNKLPEQESQVLSKAKYDRTKVPLLEQKILGFNYAEVGGALIKNWRLPESFFESVNYHLQPEKALVYRSDTFLVAIAVYCANGMEQGKPAERIVEEIESSWLSGINLEQGQIKTIIEQADSEFEQVFEMMSGNKKLH